MDGALRAAFEDAGEAAGDRRPVGGLARRLEGEIVANVFRWTGHFPERARPLVRRIARRADDLGQVYPADREAAAAVALTALVVALAMNHVYTGEYFPGRELPIPNDPPMTHQTAAGAAGFRLVGHWWVIGHFLSRRSTASPAIRLMRAGYSIPSALAAVANSPVGSR